MQSGHSLRSGARLRVGLMQLQLSTCHQWPVFPLAGASTRQPFVSDRLLFGQPPLRGGRHGFGCSLRAAGHCVSTMLLSRDGRGHLPQPDLYLHMHVKTGLALAACETCSRDRFAARETGSRPTRDRFLAASNRLQLLRPAWIARIPTRSVCVCAHA